MEVGVETEREPLRNPEVSAAAEQSYGAAGRAADGTEPQWWTVDGPLGVQQEEAVRLARNFFYGGFFFLPWLWFVNCFYFWPVLRHRHLDPLARVYVVWSAICCASFTTVLLAWVLTFTLGGETVFGDSWMHLMVYNVADKFQIAVGS